MPSERGNRRLSDGRRVPLTDDRIVTSARQADDAMCPLDVLNQIQNRPTMSLFFPAASSESCHDVHAVLWTPLSVRGRQQTVDRGG